MFKTIIKYKISILWTLSLLITLVGVIIAQFKPFNEKSSGLLMWISFNFGLLAMVFSAMKKKKKYIIVLYICSMIYITFKVVLRFI